MTVCASVAVKALPGLCSPPAELQYAAEQRPPIRARSELPFPRVLGVWGDEDGELWLDVARGSAPWDEPGRSKQMKDFRGLCS